GCGRAGRTGGGGQALPLAPDLNEGEHVHALADKGAQWVFSTLFPTYIYRLFRVEAGQEDVGAVVQGNSRLYQLMFQMRERRQRLGRLVGRTLGGEGRGPALFGGCYIAATGRDPVREQAFIAGVFRRLIENQTFVSWTADAQQEEANFETYTRYGYTGIAAGAVIAAGILAWVYLR